MDELNNIRTLAAIIAANIETLTKNLMMYFFVVGCFFFITTVPLTLAICIGILRWLS